MLQVRLWSKPFSVLVLGVDWCFDILLPSGSPHLHLLEHPTFGVWIAERGKRRIVSAFRIGTSDPALGSSVVEDPARVVEHLTHLDTPIDEFGTGCFDVVNDEVQTLN